VRNASERAEPAASRIVPGPSPATAKVVVHGVSRVFPRKGETLEAVVGVDLAVETGEFVCLLGPSGCGKSTLLNIIGGFLEPTSGYVQIDGQVVTGPHPRRVFVLQEYGIFPWASVWDNVALGLTKRPKEERERITRHYVDLVGLKGFEDSFPSEISGGMQQRVAVARALAVSPDIVFMDEPLGALDSLTRLQMRREILKIWREEKLTILFVTHDVDEALQLGERIVVMTARPGTIREIVKVDLPHPRDFGSLEYGRAKNRLFELLGVSHAV